MSYHRMLLLREKWTNSPTKKPKRASQFPTPAVYQLFNVCIAIGILHNMVSEFPDSRVHGANMGPTWVLSAPRGPHIGIMNLVIWVIWILLSAIITASQHARCGWPSFWLSGNSHLSWGGRRYVCQVCPVVPLCFLAPYQRHISRTIFHRDSNSMEHWF